MIPCYYKNEHFAETRKFLDDVGLTRPDRSSAYARAQALDDRDWDNFQHIPCYPTHLLAVWWVRHADQGLPLTHLERQFLAYKRGLLRELEAEVTRRSKLVRTPQIEQFALANLREVLSYPKVRITRKLIDFLEENYVSNL